MPIPFATRCRHCDAFADIDRLAARRGIGGDCAACGQPLLLPLDAALTGISPNAWEHPRDRLTLNALRALPGLPALIQTVGGWLADSNIRLRFLQSAVKVGPKQFPALHERMRFVARRLDLGFEPDLFVAQSPTVNAFAAGLDKPIICVQSGLLEMLDADGVTAVLAHEAAHIKSGHMLYRVTATALLLMLSRLGFVAKALNLAQLPLMVALLDWYRCSELSADRAELVATGHFDVPLRAILRMAGGGKVLGEEPDAEGFLEQARSLQDIADDNMLHRLYLLLQSYDRTHPFPVYRARELDAFSQSDDFIRILEGRYPRIGTPAALVIEEPSIRARPADPAPPRPVSIPPLGKPAEPFVSPSGEAEGTSGESSEDAWGRLANLGREFSRSLGGVGRDVAGRFNAWLGPKASGVTAAGDEGGERGEGSGEAGSKTAAPASSAEDKKATDAASPADSPAPPAEFSTTESDKAPPADKNP